MKNSGDSRLFETAAVVLALGLAAALAIWFCYRHGYILYYGDAQAHLNISRSLIDSRTPGYDQIGTVWLPLPHLICLPLVTSTRLWSNGLAGGIPVAACFVLAGTCFFLVAATVYRDILAAAVSLACFALNPNVLYLGVIPMTELVFLAGVSVYLLALVRFRDSRRNGWAALGIVASWAMSLTRYDGWFLIPFAALWFALVAPEKRRIHIFFAIVALCGLAPLYWLAHCWWETGNPLDFYNGPYSARAIQAGKPYPGYRDWAAAFTYYGAAGRLCAGRPLILLGTLGAGFALARERFLVPAFLLLTPAFYIWSIHSSGTPIFVPELWPHGYYNTRYGIAVVALCAFCAGAVVLGFPKRLRRYAFLLPLIALFPWLVNFSPSNVITWKESQVNSRARRVWTEAAAGFLRQNYQPGAGIVAPFGDLTGIFCHAGISLREVLHEGNGPAWLIAMRRPDLAHAQLWGIVQQGSIADGVFSGSHSYVRYQTLPSPEPPSVDIFQRHDLQNPIR